ncbi:MAG: M56 family metallopeptidase, partial [Myxococcota bacterium]
MIEAIVLGLLHSLWLGALCYVVTVLVLGAVDEEHARLRAAIVALSQHALVVAVGIYGALESRPSMAAAVGPTTAFDALFAVWCVGIASSGWRLFWDLAEARRLVATSTPFAHPAFDRLIACAGNRVRVGLRLTYERVQPSVIGVLRPIILLPAACVNSLSVPELEAILAHELA